VFHHNGKPIRDPRRAWQKAAIAVGLGQMIEIEKNGKKKKKYVGRTMHDFRRTRSRDLIRSGTPEAVAMKITGHKTRSVFDRYNIVNEADLREAAKRRAAYVQEQEEKARKVVALRGA